MKGKEHNKKTNLPVNTFIPTLCSSDGRNKILKQNFSA